MLSLTVASGLLTALGDRAQAVERRAPEFTPTHGSHAPLARVRVIDTGTDEATLFELGAHTGDISPPPGMPSWPRVGELWLSPAATREVAHNPYLAAITPGHVVGRIGQVGLRGPEDVVVVMGVADQALRGRPGVGRVMGFGGSSASGSEVATSQEFSGRSLAFLDGLVLSILGLAGLSLMSSVARVADEARRRRLAVLHLLGAPMKLIRAVSAAHSACWSVVGAALGFACSWPAARVISGVGIAGIKWWPTSSFNPAVVGLALALTVPIATLGGMRSVPRDTWRTTRRAPDRSLSPIRWVPLTVGAFSLAGVLLAQWRHRSEDLATPPRLAVILLGASSVSLLGVILVTPLITRQLARLVQKRVGATTPGLAAARVDHHVRESARRSLALVALVVACGVVVGASASLSWQSQGRATAWRTVGVPRVGDAGDHVPLAAIAGALDAKGVEAASVTRRSGLEESLRSPREVLPDDLGYLFEVDPTSAPGVAAAIQSAWPQAPALITDRDLPGERGVTLMSGTLVVALLLSALMVLAALGVNLIALQHQRRGPDIALLMVGMPLRSLAAVRGWEVAMSATPSALLASLLAVGISGGVAHLDHANVPFPALGLAIPLIALAIGALLALIAARLSPRPRASDYRRA